MLESFVKLADEENSDFVSGGVNFLNPDDSIIGNRFIKNDFDMTPSEHIVYYTSVVQFYNNFYSKLFKISTLKNNNIFIEEDYNSVKYLAFINKLIKHSETLSFISGLHSNYYTKEKFPSKNINFEKFDDTFKQLDLLNDLLSSTKSNSEENNIFTNLIFLDAIKDCCELISASKAQKKEKLSAIRKIMRNETFKEQYHKLIPKDPVSTNTQKALKLFILSNIYSIYENSKTNDELYSYLTFIYPDIDKFWTKSDLNNFIINDKMLIALVQKDAVGLFEHINTSSLLNKPKLNTEVAFFNAFTITKNIDDLSFCFERLEKGFTKKQLDFIINNNNLTKTVDNNEIILKFKSLLFNIVTLNYSELCAQIYDIVSTNDNLRQDEFLCLADVLENAGRADRNADYVAYSVQMKLLVAIQNKEEDKFNKYIQDLKDMNVEDEILQNFTNMYNEQ